MRRPVAAALAMVGILAVAGCTGAAAPRDSAGQVTASASADAFAVKVGDCTGDLGSGEITSAVLLPCHTQHHFEAYATTQLIGTEFPGEAGVARRADAFCSEAFTAFLGVPPETSRYGVFYLYPTADTWALGDREVTCLAGDEKGGIIGSLRGVKK